MLRFYRGGKWVPVVIDDRLPVNGGAPAFARSTDPTEFWPALLEKAFAKWYGCYENLVGGWVSDALVGACTSLLASLFFLLSSFVSLLSCR